MWPICVMDYFKLVRLAEADTKPFVCTCTLEKVLKMAKTNSHCLEIVNIYDKNVFQE